MGRLIHVFFFRYVNPAALVSENSVLKALSAQVDHNLKYKLFITSCLVAWYEGSHHRKAVTTTWEDSEAKDPGREWERDALHPQEDNEPRSPWSSPARDDARHSEGLERECGADLSYLQVPSDYKEPIPPPARPSGKGALQGQNSCRFANKETVSKEHYFLRRWPYF